MTGKDLRAFLKDVVSIKELSLILPKIAPRTSHPAKMGVSPDTEYI
jgi:hypothetical protein